MTLCAVQLECATAFSMPEAQVSAVWQDMMLELASFLGCRIRR